NGVAERRHVLLASLDACSAEAAALGDVDGADRLHVAREVAPQTQARQDLLRAIRKRRDARVEARLREELNLLRLDEHDVERQLAERARERRPDGATSCDQDVAVAAQRSTHALPPFMCCSISATVVGTPCVSTSGPLRVTCTSSSMRMPMPRQRLSTLLSLAET